jgi:hypothetical protein
MMHLLLRPRHDRSSRQRSRCALAMCEPSTSAGAWVADHVRPTSDTWPSTQRHHPAPYTGFSGLVRARATGTCTGSSSYGGARSTAIPAWNGSTTGGAARPSNESRGASPLATKSFGSVLTLSGAPLSPTSGPTQHQALAQPRRWQIVAADAVSSQSGPVQASLCGTPRYTTGASRMIGSSSWPSR